MSTVLADRLLQTAIESNMKIGDQAARGRSSLRTGST